MSILSEKFHEQFNRMQQNFDEWTPFEQFYASIECTKKLQISYRYTLSQLLFQDNHQQQENNDMFHHTIHQANTPAILACLLADPLDKIISTLQLYLPLVSISTSNEKLLEAYGEVLKYLDSKLTNPTNFSYSEQHLINLCQQIKFFIQINPCLQKFLVDLPQLNALTSSATTRIDEKFSSTQKHQSLQRYPAVRLYQPTTSLTPSPLFNFSSEGSPNAALCQQLLHNDASDSGVDLSESGITNSVQNFLPSPPSQHAIAVRSHSANLPSTNVQDNQNNHPLVVKTSSSPTPEQSAPSRSTMVPLSAVLSAPAPAIHSYGSDFRHSNYQQQPVRPTLTISDEDEEDSQLQGNYMSNKNFYSDMNAMNNSNRLRQFCSLRNRNPKNNPNNPTNYTDNVSPYLGIDGHTGSVRNTFIQPNSGMRDVPKWLKNLRLHKYAFFFSQMTYDQMMNLTIDQLKEGKITDGACTKILLNVKKLKERQTLLQQYLLDIDNGQVDIKTMLQHLNELMLTPIRAKQENDNEEDLPKLIMQVLEKVYQQLTSNSASTSLLSDMCNNLVGLFDRCYKHEAFSADQRHTLLHWRGPLCNKLQTSGKIEYKSMQSSSSLNRRVQLKPQTSMGNMNTSQVNKPAVRNIKSTLSYYSNYPTNSIPLTRQTNSSENGNHNINITDANLIRRPIKSPTVIFTPNNDGNDDGTAPSTNHHLSIASSHSLQESSYHQIKSFMNERSGNGSGNLHPSFNYTTSTPQRPNGAYLAANQHQLLTRKTSIGPYGESNNPEDKTKLCKTYSDPNRIRFYNSNPMANIPNQISPPQQSNFLMTSTPYTSRQYLSHSQPTPTDSNHLFDTSLLHQSPIQKCFSDRETSVFYTGDETNHHLPLNDSHDHSSNQRHNSAEFDTFCRQITESALSDDVPESPIKLNDGSLHFMPTTNSTDNDQ